MSNDEVVIPIQKDRDFQTRQTKTNQFHVPLSKTKYV